MLHHFIVHECLDLINLASADLPRRWLQLLETVVQDGSSAAWEVLSSERLCAKTGSRTQSSRATSPTTSHGLRNPQGASKCRRRPPMGTQRSRPRSRGRRRIVRPMPSGLSQPKGVLTRWPTGALVDGSKGTSVPSFWPPLVVAVQGDC